MLNHRSQNDSDKEQRDVERRFREKELEAQRYHLGDSRKHRAHYELDKFSRRSKEELKRGKGFTPDRGKKGSQDGGGPVGAAETPGREKSEDELAAKKEDTGSKVLLFSGDNLSLHFRLLRVSTVILQAYSCFSKQKCFF